MATVKRIFELQGQGHTLACLLNDALFAQGASFAACIVPHPRADALHVHVASAQPAATLLAALSACEDQVDGMLRQLG